MENPDSNSRDDNQVHALMKGGGCKESFMALKDCVEKNKESNMYNCMDFCRRLNHCMVTHSDYYKPFLVAGKAADQVGKKALEPFLKREGDVKGEDELRVRFEEFMKGGSCKKSFKAWYSCKDDTPKCRASHSTSIRCLEAHSHYYQPYLAANKAAYSEYLKIYSLP